MAGEVDEARGAIVEIVDELGKGNGGGDAEVVAIAMAGALEGVGDQPQFLVEGEARIRGGSVGSEEPNLHWFGSVGKWPWCRRDGWLMVSGPKTAEPARLICWPIVAPWF